jgi:hypothetical protein
MNTLSYNLNIENNLLVDKHGVLQAHKGGYNPRSCSHIQRVRCNRLELKNTYFLLTGVTPEAQDEAMIALAMEWVAAHTGCEEAGVYRALAKEGVLGWFKQEYYNWADAVKRIILSTYEDAYDVAAYREQYPVHARATAQKKALERYTGIQAECLNPKTAYCQKLETGYAQLW